MPAVQSDSRGQPISQDATWQFSLRSLFILVTLASILLAIGVYIGGVLVAAAVVGVLQVGTLFGVDLLIRPKYRRALVFVTSASWAIVRSSLIIVGVVLGYQTYWSNSPARAGVVVTAFFMACGLTSYYVARVRWRGLSMPIRSTS